MSYSNGTQLKSSSSAGPTGTTNNNNNNNGGGPPRQPLPAPGRPQSYSYSRDSDRLQWEMRPANRTPNTTPVSTVLNSPDLTDLDTKLRYQHSTLMQHHQIKVGRSPVGSGGNNDSNNSTNPSSPTLQPSQPGRHQADAAFSSFSLLSDGEMVVFDDIDTTMGLNRNWRMSGDRDILGSSPVPSESENEEEDNSCASGGQEGGGRDDERNYYDVDSSKIQRIIGGLTIAEYEGSPRRFGMVDRDDFGGDGGGGGGFGGGRSAGMPRPGFPKRVISPSPQASPTTDSQSELIDLNDDGDGSRLRTLSNESKFNLTYVDYFTSTNDELSLMEEGEQNNQTPTNLLTNIDNGDEGGGGGNDQDYFFSYNATSTNRNAQSNAYVAQRLATKSNRSGSGQEEPGDEDDDDDEQQSSTPIGSHLSNNYPYYHKHSNNQYHYANTNAQQQAESHNQQERYYHSHYASSHHHHHHHHHHGFGTGTTGGGGGEAQDIELFIDSGSRSGGESEAEQQQQKQQQQMHHHQQQQHQHQHQHSHHMDSKIRSFTLSPETTDYDSNCGDLDSEVSLRYMGNEYGLSGDLNGLSGHVGSGGSGGNENVTDYGRLYSSMPILEDGLSSGHASDTENNVAPPSLSGISIVMDQLQLQQPDDPSAIEQETGYPFISSIQMGAEQVCRTDVEQQQPPQLDSSDEVQEAIKDIKAALQMTKILPSTEGTSVLDPEQDGRNDVSPVWVPRSFDKSRESLDSDQPVKLLSADEEEADTDLETDRLLGQQRLDDHGFGDEKDPDKKGKCKTKEGLLDPAVLIEGVLFRARYLGSTQLVCEGQPTKSTRMMQAEEAVSRIKAPEGESQPSTEVDLFISTEKIMVLNTDLKEIMMDHALRTISYIADIGDLVVLMARRRFVPQDVDPGDPAAPLVAAALQTSAANATTGGVDGSGNNNSPPKKSLPRGNRTPKMICHVFESEEAQFIAQSIGQAFQVAYMEFLKANGIEDHSFMKEMDYQEVLNSQEIFGDELQIFAKKELQKEVVVPKAKGEILGVVIVESGWGSMLPTVVIANLASSGAAARCGQLNIGDQIIAINGLSLVGLPLSTCQGYIKNTKNQTAVKFTVVPCAPVVEVRIKRPNTKYQLGFSVQNGVICSLLRGGIAERGGVRVGHRIIEINNQSVVAVPHEKIVNLLATSVGEIHMKTMPTSMFRLLTGQENPVYI
ncbi:amyloid-beta A4 precursor protein-binding family A member 2-like isoform X2 [Ochlerotatus camptorhynchus]|uniref:amyloid-beta A4 precursor protein-binding family A member 2-like isoform X2 n=1 Tax=Ochlerotatus camptorhynchus TaxID=644619 RepID=UPI0031CFFE44